MISVVFSAIDCSQTARSAVLSTLHALGNLGEVVFHLDPSSDDSLEVLESIKDKRLRLLPTSRNLGFANGLNEAISASRFGIIARMDADDVCLPWRFSLQLKLMKSFGLDALYSTALVFGKPVKPFGLMPQFPVSMSKEEITLTLATRNPLVHPTLFAKKDVILEVGGYGKAIAEDYELHLKLALAQKSFMRHWAPTVLYRVHDKQATASADWQRRVDNDHIIRARIRDLRRLLSITSDDELDARLSNLHGQKRLLGLEARGVSGIIRRSSKERSI